MSNPAISVVAAATPTKRRRGALTTANRHWTDALVESEHATTRLGARFHLRKLFLRADVDEFSQSELEFIIQYLVNETTIAEQPWWAALTDLEQLEIVNMLELHHIVKGEEQTIWFSSRETSKDCILLYGNAEAKPTDPAFAPLLTFMEGSVVGNMKLSSSSSLSVDPGASDRNIDVRRGSLDALPPVVLSADASPDIWRRVKREHAFRNSLHFYNKLRIIGPADFFVLTSTDITQTTAKAAERLEREQLLRLYGLERFLGCIRQKVFESGAVLATENERLEALYFILEGECRATVRVDSPVDAVDAFAEKTNAANTTAADAMLHGHRPTNASLHRLTQLPIASLGPRSLVGDVSMLLGLREPATIQAVTAVVVLALSQEDYLKEVDDMSDVEIAAPVETMKKVALETMGFVLERVMAEAAYNSCDQTKKIRSMQHAIAAKQPEMDTPQSRQLVEMMAYTRPTPYKSLASNGKQSSHSQRDLAPRPSSSARSKPKIPAVVQQYIETVSSQKSQHASMSLAPVILSRRRSLTHGEGSSTHLTREQRKAALVLNGLHSPLAGKSLGGHGWPSAAANLQDDDTDESEKVSSIGDTFQLDHVNEVHKRQDQQRRRQPAIDDHLFLFPTMTRQRQLHARSLPLLPKYKGVEINNR